MGIEQENRQTVIDARKAYELVEGIIVRSECCICDARPTCFVFRDLAKTRAELNRIVGYAEAQLI